MDYFRPEGWRPGLPDVFIRPEVFTLIGSAMVRYETLAEMYQGSLKLKPDQMPRTVFKRYRTNLTRRNPQELVLGHCATVRNTSYIDPVAIAQAGYSQDTITQTMVYHGLLC